MRTRWNKGDPFTVMSRANTCRSFVPGTILSVLHILIQLVFIQPPCCFFYVRGRKLRLGDCWAPVPAWLRDPLLLSCTGATWAARVLPGMGLGRPIGRPPSKAHPKICARPWKVGCCYLDRLQILISSLLLVLSFW